MMLLALLLVACDGAQATSGSVAFSDDGGATWTDVSEAFPLEQAVRGVSYDGAGRWVAVGSRGVATSTDGIDWTDVTEAYPHRASPNAVAHASDLGWVAVGTAGHIATSKDGLRWEAAEVDVVAALQLTTVAAGDGGLWMAAGGRVGRAYLTSSTDGLAWTDTREGYPHQDRAIRELAHANGLWIALGERGTAAASPDGLTWNDLSDTLLGELDARHLAAARPSR